MGCYHLRFVVVRSYNLGVLLHALDLHERRLLQHLTHSLSGITTRCTGIVLRLEFEIHVTLHNSVIAHVTHQKRVGAIGAAIDSNKS